MLEDIVGIITDKINSQNDIDTYVGNRIRIKRSLMGLSQKDLAKKVGISADAISKYETGKNSISVNTLYKIAEYFEVPIEYFFITLKQ